MSIFSALAHLFTPRVSNNHKAKVLHWEVIAILIAVVVFGNKYVIQKTPGILGFASQISTSEVIRLTNVKRAEAGLQPVVENSLLDNAAKQKGVDMLNKGYWAHVAPDGTQPWDFFKKVNYKYKYAGENLARDFTSASSAVDAWMASPSHRENMLNDKYKDIGVAVVDGSLAGQDATIIVQLFGTLAADRPQIPVASAKEVQKAATEAATPTNEPNPTIIPVAKVSDTQIPPPQLTVNSNPPETAFNVSKILSGAVIGILLLVMLFDVLLVWKQGSVRKSSRPLAQIAFLGMILAIIIVARAGQII